MARKKCEVGDVCKYLQASYEKPANLQPTGYREWDQLSGGLVRGGVTVLGGRPAMGRTSLVLNIVSRIAREEAGTILIVSPEIGEQELSARILQIGIGTSICNLLNGSLHPTDAAARCAAVVEAQKAKIRFYTSSYPTLEEIQGHCERISDLRMILLLSPEEVCQPFDFCDYINFDNIPREPQERTVGFLKNMAKKYDIPVLCTVRMHRSLEYRKNQRPKLTDLKKIRLSANLVDQIVFLYRDRYYNFESDDTAEVILAKTPRGQTGTVKLWWVPDSGEFLEPGDL